MLEIDLSHLLDFREISFENIGDGTSAGMLLKSTIIKNGIKYYIKLGAYEKYSGFYKDINESVMELINSRIGELLGIPVLKGRLYRCIVELDSMELETFAFISRDYSNNYSKCVSLEKWCNVVGFDGEKPFDVIKRYGLQDSIYRQFIYDYIICNMDRHGKNNDLLLDNNSGIKLAPFFDNSSTFVTYKTEKAMKEFALYDDTTKVNNFIGSKILLENLNLIDSEIIVKDVLNSDREKLFQGLELYTSSVFRDYVWFLLNRRILDVKEQKIPFIQWI